jgi:hypothetical protein
MLDDSLLANTILAVLDVPPPSLLVVEGGFAASSCRAPSHAMLNDGVLQKPPRGDTRWHTARKSELENVLDSPLSVLARSENPGERHQTPHQVVLDNIPSSSTPWDGSRRPHTASLWQRLVLDGGRSSSPFVGGARQHRVVKARLCRYWILGSRRIQSWASRTEYDGCLTLEVL